MISADNMYEDVRYLTEDIGIRLAGSPEEHRTARYLQNRFLEYVPKCTLEAFPVSCRDVKEEELSILLDGQWRRFPATLFGGHTDTQAGTVGADDNAIGCAIMLELARVLSKKKLRHTLRFVAFGSEEQLSVGSAAYVRSHRQEINARGRFMPAAQPLDGTAL